MKFYTRVLGGHAYYFLETVHFGLRLPATISSFGDMRSVSISDWSVVKPGHVLQHTSRDYRATLKHKREKFDDCRGLSFKHNRRGQFEALSNVYVVAFIRRGERQVGSHAERTVCGVIRRRVGNTWTLSNLLSAYRYAMITPTKPSSNPLFACPLPRPIPIGHHQRDTNSSSAANGGIAAKRRWLLPVCVWPCATRLNN